MKAETNHIRNRRSHILNGMLHWRFGYSAIFCYLSLAKKIRKDVKGYGANCGMAALRTYADTIR